MAEEGRRVRRLQRESGGGSSAEVPGARLNGAGAAPAEAVSRPPASAQVLLFLLLWTSFAYFAHGPGWGQVSRMNLVMAVVDEGTLVLDRYRGTTGDTAFYEGHSYHEKAPGGALLGVVPYWLFSRVVRRPAIGVEPAWSRYYGRALYVTTCLSTGLLSALAGVALFRLLFGIFRHGPAALITVLIYSLGTLVLVYAGEFQSHGQAAALVAIGLYLAWLGRHASGPPRDVRLAGAGFCLALAASAEYQDAFLAVAVGVYVIAATRSWSSVLWFVLGALPPVGLVLLFNRACFGRSFTAGYAYVDSARWRAVHGGALLGFGPPRLDVWATLLFTRWRGLFVFSPAGALAIPGAVLWWRQRRHRAELVLCVAVFVFFPLYLSGFGPILTGHQFGPRFLVPVLPFAALLMAPCVKRWRAWSIAVGILSAGLALSGAAVNPQVRPSIRYPITQYLLPRLIAGDFPKQSYGANPEAGVTRPIQYRPFNLGMKLGLRGLPSLVPLIALWLIGVGCLVWLLQPRRAACAGRGPPAQA